MEPVKKPWGNRILIAIFLVSFLAVIGMNYHRYYQTKDYDYLVETSCDPSVKICFARDCDEADGCPPNGLAIYAQYHVKAYDFPKCIDNSCAVKCASGVIQCIEIVCDINAGDSCAAVPTPPQE